MQSKPWLKTKEARKKRRSRDPSVLFQGGGEKNSRAEEKWRRKKGLAVFFWNKKRKEKRWIMFDVRCCNMMQCAEKNHHKGRLSGQLMGVYFSNEVALLSLNVAWGPSISLTLCEIPSFIIWQCQWQFFQPDSLNEDEALAWSKETWSCNWRLNHGCASSFFLFQRCNSVFKSRRGHFFITHSSNKVAKAASKKTPRCLWCEWGIILGIFLKGRRTLQTTTLLNTGHRDAAKHRAKWKKSGRITVCISRSQHHLQ